MAKSLGRSLARHCPDIPRAVFSQSSDPELHRLFTVVDSFPPGMHAVPEGFEVKLHLDQLAPFEETIFIDADCLAFRSLEPAWRLFENSSVGVLGRRTRVATPWYEDSDEVRRQFSIDEFPTFNGGMYFIRRDGVSAAIFETARRLVPRFDELRMVRMRGHKADEPLLALSLAIHGVRAVDDTSSPLMRTLGNTQGGIVADAMSGACRIIKNGEQLSPAVLHFCTRRGRYVYYRECYRLAFADALATLSPWKELLARGLAVRDYVKYRAGNLKTKLADRCARSAILLPRPRHAAS